MLGVSTAPQLHRSLLDRRNKPTAMVRMQTERAAAEWMAA